jgi:hypothetical protein
MNVLALCLNRGMSVPENRLAHLRAIVEMEAERAHGSERQRFSAAYHAVAQSAGLAYDYVYQLYKAKSGKGKIGDEAAAKLDRAYGNGRAPGWIDMAPQHASDLADFDPIRPPTVHEAVFRLAELLVSLDEDGRAMASTALSNLARNPERAAKAAETLAMLGVIHPREPDPTPAQPITAGAAPAGRGASRAKLTVKTGGGQKLQLDLPLKTVLDPFDQSSAPANERAWYERVRAAPKASEKK